MENQTGDHVYRYRTNRWLYFFYTMTALIVLKWSCVSIGLLWWTYFTPAYRQVISPEKTDLIIFLIAMSIIMITNLILWTGLIVVEILRTKRTHIVVYDTGLTITDWRNRETHLDWDDIQEVWIKTTTGRIIQTVDKIIVGRKRIWIRQEIEKRQELLDEIISRAHLTEKSSDWYQTRYSRPV